MTGISIPPKDRAVLAPLFQDVRPCYVLDAILEGRMGEAWADNAENPRACLLLLGKIVLLGGDAGAPQTRALLRAISPVVGIWRSHHDWLPLLHEIPGAKLVQRQRWSMSAAHLDVHHLRSLAQRSPAGLHLVDIDLPLAQRIPEALETDYQINPYGSARAFMSQGFGMALLDDQRPVAAVSAFAVCQAGVEVQINIHDAYRRRGLATLLAANFALKCLSRGLDPHWDASSLASVALAQKVGYVLAEEYVTLVLACA